MDIMFDFDLTLMYYELHSDEGPPLGAVVAFEVGDFIATRIITAN